eukprot:TRINITY_DN16483_c0_g1_i1.p1 TRINITY_DN16483_c0_g1~~TRINITY_DN16483_c0_g1_i1.p1  ORF type:complete len:163 (-),score=30.30 TRINITY_DN16483_c0_g1_i1:116-604(-)
MWNSGAHFWPEEGMSQKIYHHQSSQYPVAFNEAHGSPSLQGFDKETDSTVRAASSQKSSSGSSDGEDWRGFAHSAVAEESGLVDLDPEVGRQRGTELLAMLSDGPLGREDARDPKPAGQSGHRQRVSSLRPTAQAWTPGQGYFAPENIWSYSVDHSMERLWS